MEEQLSLWAGEDTLPVHAPMQESTKPVQERSLHDELEQELLWVIEWAQQHGWWKLSYLEWDGSWKHIGPGKERWDTLPSHLGTYDVGRAFHFAKQWEVLETRPGVVAGEFVVDVPSLLPPVDREYGQRRLLELGAECDYWPIHWRLGQKRDVLLFGLRVGSNGGKRRRRNGSRTRSGRSSGISNCHKQASRVPVARNQPPFQA